MSGAAALAPDCGAGCGMCSPARARHLIKGELQQKGRDASIQEGIPTGETWAPLHLVSVPNHHRPRGCGLKVLSTRLCAMHPDLRDRHAAPGRQEA